MYTHRPAWDRLDVLTRRRRLNGPESDELIALYQSASLQLSTLLSRAPEPAVVAGLGALLARARIAIVGGRRGSVRMIGEFFLRRFPAAVYQTLSWWTGVAAVFLAVTTGISAWIANSADIRNALGLTRTEKALTRPGGGYERYYFEHSHGAFTAHVWTNNAWVAATALFTGLLIIPAMIALGYNAFNLAVGCGLMAHANRLPTFLGYLLPHGMLELTAIFVAGGAGLALGATLIDPGRRSRSEALAHQGRTTATIAIGLTVVLLVSGLLEGFVTPSGWPTTVRVTIGALAELLFLAYVVILGRPASRRCLPGDR